MVVQQELGFSIMIQSRKDKVNVSPIVQINGNNAINENCKRNDKKEC